MSKPTVSKLQAERIKEYLNEFTSEGAWGGEGYLSEKGLIPMPDAERKKYRNATKNMEALESLK